MVLEHLFPDNWLEKKIRYSFILAFVYSTLGIIASRLLFGASSGIVSVVFTSILLIPYLRKLLKEEETLEKKEKRFSFMELYRDNKTAIKVYFSFFFGIYVVYMMYSFILPMLGFDAFSLFKEQLLLDPALRGDAVSIGAVFVDIVLNNWWVLLACFLLALVSGDGAIFFITWNASSWGILFGHRALIAALNADANPLWFLFLIFMITLPYVILEAAAYIFAAISGGVISDEIIEKSSEIRRFLLYAGGLIGFYLLIFFSIRYFFQWNIWFSFGNMILMVGMVHLVGRIFDEKKHKEVFIYNYWLFIIAIVMFLIGALIESVILGNSATLAEIYSLSMLGP
ncbi:hypothetical protein COT47_05290 [Candidatus Woesearchaeota archaeon CG08_land_8_20_14_0_20_43_7]|nr:MAG: hypothetical protein COT47_05290 [Candidatus Woesearchaeota archaeon CG08_land_8_20_14_0_20_43_7]